MKNLIIIIAIGFVFFSCSQSEKDIKRQSLDDVYFFLSTANIVEDPQDIQFVSLNKVDDRGNYSLDYVIKEKKDSLYLTNYYNEENVYIHFNIKMSSKLKLKIDSINRLNEEKEYFPYTKRWKWGVN